MSRFLLGSTVICSIEVRDSSTNALADPETSMEVVIYNPAGAIQVAATAMTKDSTGVYHYDFVSTTAMQTGSYRVIYVDTDSTRITKKDDDFELYS
jgi:hypothetical protein